jgi:hypothetical protein
VACSVVTGIGAATRGTRAGGRRGIGLVALLLTVVAASRLLWEAFACGFEEWTGSAGAEVERHEQTMGAGESKDMSFAHFESAF